MVKLKKELAIKEDVETIIKNLTSDTVKTKLETQFKIFKQELDNRKIKKINELINNKIINLNSNNIFENQNIANKNFKHFDLSIRDTVNNQEQQSSTNLDNNWNKVKSLLTT